jgi:uncharacterized protein with GYD domain
LNWTNEGIKAAKDSPARLDKARDLARGVGVEVEQAFMTIGDADMVCIVDAPSDEAFAMFSLKLASGGAIRSKTLKAFTEDEYRKIMAAL